MRHTEQAGEERPGVVCVRAVEAASFEAYAQPMSLSMIKVIAGLGSAVAGSLLFLLMAGEMYGPYYTCATDYFDESTLP